MKGIMLWLWLSVWCLPGNVWALDLMLPQVYTDDIDVSGWLVSEKLDGIRGYWDGTKLLSKNGNPLYPPAAFTAKLPPFALEGELWGGRGTFEKTLAIVRQQHPHAGWLKLRFAIFDVPQATGGFTERLLKAKDWFDNHPSRFAFIIAQKEIKDREQLKTELERVEKLGGEGLIVRKPASLYATGRSSEILKVKSFFDMEAVVIGHVEGKGRNRGRLGSLLVELPDKTRLKIGTGFSDAERIDPPSIGSVITFKYYGFYESGRPKFPSFMRIKTDSSL